jgi:hypothetical protein
MFIAPVCYMWLTLLDSLAITCLLGCILQYVHWKYGSLSFFTVVNC